MVQFISGATPNNILLFDTECVLLLIWLGILGLSIPIYLQSTTLGKSILKPWVSLRSIMLPWSQRRAAPAPPPGHTQRKWQVCGTWHPWWLSYPTGWMCFEHFPFTQDASLCMLTVSWAHAQGAGLRWQGCPSLAPGQSRGPGLRLTRFQPRWLPQVVHQCCSHHHCLHGLAACKHFPYTTHSPTWEKHNN